MVRGVLCAAFVALPAIATAQTRAVTYHEDVVPVLQKHCQTCHRPGEAAPFSMLTYKDTRPWASSMKRAAVSRKMPPWHADPTVGHFGNDRRLSQEEIDVIAPAIARLRAAGHDVSGPLPADTVFVPGIAEGFDAIVAMYHDQGLPVLKAASFGAGVNVTLGLPFIRTSVDHGTALDLAADAERARGVDPGSLFAALDLAIGLAQRCSVSSRDKGCGIDR